MLEELPRRHQYCNIFSLHIINEGTDMGRTTLWYQALAGGLCNIIKHANHIASWQLPSLRQRFVASANALNCLVLITLAMCVSCCLVIYALEKLDKSSQDTLSFTCRSQRY